MPSRKQRRRRDKSFRHEYETVLLDEEGNETPIAEVRGEREKTKAETKPKSASAKGKTTAKGRSLREPPVPSWNRALRRGGLMGAIVFIAFVFILKGGSQTSRAAIAAIYAVAFIPLTYYVDRFAYARYQKQLARQNEKK
jgi:hypothetical protein